MGVSGQQSQRGSSRKVGPRHRRRIKTEAKTKVVASVWRKECIKFLAALAFLHWDDFEA